MQTSNKKIEPDFEKTGGLVPAIAQDSKTGRVLMMAYMDREAWRATISTRKATYYSRSRKKLWVKGESSGHIQHVHEIRIDCDRDTVLLIVEQVGGAACHKGYESCFYTRINDDGSAEISEKPVFDPDEVYKK